MRPYLLVGPDKACYDFAKQLAEKNYFHFFHIQAKDFGRFEKNYFSSSLDNCKTLFYLADADKLTVPQSQKLVEMATESPHLFYMASASKINWYLRKNCIYKPLVAVKDEINDAIKILLTECNRNIAFLKLKGIDAEYLFHILKFGAYRSPETLEAMLRVSRNLYKVNDTYFLSMLVFDIPPKPFPFGFRKNKENTIQKSIKKKIRSVLKRYNSSEIAEVYQMMKSFKKTLGLDLTDDEKDFLDVQDSSVRIQPQADKPFVKYMSFEEFF